ncbi:uncharacterized protein ACIB01_016509 [Guaruba guarouba]
MCKATSGRSALANPFAPPRPLHEQGTKNPTAQQSEGPLQTRCPCPLPVLTRCRIHQPLVSTGTDLLCTQLSHNYQSLSSINFSTTDTASKPTNDFYNEFIVMGNEECGNSAGRDREEINEMQKTQCVGHQDMNHLGH